MLAGDTPPPGPEELLLRPLDVSALIDAVSDIRLLSGQSIVTNTVAMIGPVLLAWINEQLGEDCSFTFSGGGWGDNVTKVLCALQILVRFQSTQSLFSSIGKRFEGFSG